MRRWKINYADTSNEVIGKTDIWTGLPGVVSVEDLGADAAQQSSARVLSKTAFQDYAVSQLGGGVTGMGRFTDIMDATADSPVSAVRFAYTRYEAAQTFEKSNVAALTQIMAANGTMTAEERTAILENWPEA